MIDSSGLFALEPDVPLVVPEVNPYVLADYRNRNVIAVADSLTSQLLAALAVNRSGDRRASPSSVCYQRPHRGKSGRCAGRTECEVA